MKKILLFSAFVSAFAIGAAKADNPGCGLGSMVFAGKHGPVFDVLAATTNGTSGNQTFGMSTGTLGCKRNVPIARRQFAYFMNNNYEQFAMDAASGKDSETMRAAAAILKVDSVKLASVVKTNFDSIFTDDAESLEIAARIEKLVA
ncbi:MAG: DUF3015 family protein [Alphaproteobacteria bacterium]|nr:DUF3015 family protein [Alphaproteobacteria bacterium]MBN2780267.1 DUF3015 family protein [Alphaproteobacteria bacterium]